MSIGSPRRTMRFPEHLIEQIEAAIDSANQRRADVPYDWTGWVLQAVREKLRSLERGRTSSRRRRPGRRAAAPPAAGQPHQVLGSAHADLPAI